MQERATDLLLLTCWIHVTGIVPCLHLVAHCQVRQALVVKVLLIRANVNPSVPLVFINGLEPELIRSRDVDKELARASAEPDHFRGRIAQHLPDLVELIVFVSAREHRDSEEQLCGNASQRPHIDRQVYRRPSRTSGER